MFCLLLSPICDKLFHYKIVGFWGGAVEIKQGSVLTMKKKHPCGGCEWEVLYAGSDLKLKCRGCGHMIMLPRSKALKDIKAVENPENGN